MAGCNCAAPTPIDPRCCVQAPEATPCVLPVPRSYYCGFCENGVHTLACQTWVDCCAANRIAVTLAGIRFKTQTGRDAVFGLLRFDGATGFSKYERFPAGMMVNLNTPSIFDTLVSIAAAAAYRDRIGEKTHFSRGNLEQKKKDRSRERAAWSYNDSSNAFHKHVTLLRSLLRTHCVSRSRFEQSYSLQWVPAGTPVLNIGDTPFLGQLNNVLKSSCFGLWMDGAFAVVTQPPSSSGELKYSEDMIIHPVNPWNTPLPCDGYVTLFRSDGSVDVIPYHYDCRTFKFDPVVSTIVGDKEQLRNFIQSIRQMYQARGGEDFQCAGWLDVVDPQPPTDTPVNPAPGPRPVPPVPSRPDRPPVVPPTPRPPPSGPSTGPVPIPRPPPPLGPTPSPTPSTQPTHNPGEYHADSETVLSDVYRTVKLAGDNLLKVGLLRSADPYCVVFVRKDGKWAEVGRTEFLRGTTSPEWKDEVNIPTSIGEDGEVKFRVFNTNVPLGIPGSSRLDWRQEEAIGTARCKLSQLSKLVGAKLTLKLTEEETGRRDADFGFLYVSVLA